MVSQQGIEGPDTMANLMWANIYISGYVMHNSVDIVMRSTNALHTSLCARKRFILVVFAPQMASIQWHAIGTE